jgi:hypothetical protein
MPVTTLNRGRMPLSDHPTSRPAPRRRVAYIIRNGRLAEDWNEVERSTLSIANRAVATLTTNSGVDDLYRMYALAKRDGVGFRLAFTWCRSSRFRLPSAR